MSLVVAIVVGLLMGAVFGLALEKSRVFEPGMIVGQMQLRNFIMLKIFLTAVATGAVVLAALNGFGLVKLQPKAALYAADLVGGFTLGVGIALAGACPGTTLAQIGAGYRDAVFTLAGGLLGAVAYAYAQPWLATTFLPAATARSPSPGSPAFRTGPGRSRSPPSSCSCWSRWSAGVHGARNSGETSTATFLGRRRHPPCRPTRRPPSDCDRWI